MKVEIELSLGNVGRLYELFDEENNTDSLEKCLNFLELNSWQLIDNEPIFSQLPFKLIRKLITRDSFSVKEVDLFTAIHRWHQNNQTYSKEEVYDGIRWNLITAEEFAAHVRAKEVIGDAEYFNSFHYPKRERASLAIAMLPVNSDVGDNGNIGATTTMNGSALLPSGSLCDPLQQSHQYFAPQVEINAVAEEESNLVNFALHLCQSETLTRTENCERSIDCILMLIEQRVSKRNLDYALLECLNTLKILLSQSNLRQSINCDRFLIRDGVVCLIHCFQAFTVGVDNSPNNALLVDLLQIIKIIVELSHVNYRSAIVCSDIIEKCCELLLNANVSFTAKYLSAYVLLSFGDTGYLDGSPIASVDCDFIKTVKESIESWELHTNIDTDYLDADHLRNVLTMAKRNRPVAYRLFAIWLLAYLTTSDASEYCRIATKSEVQTLFVKTRTPQSKTLAAIVMKNYDTFEAMNEPSQSTKKRGKRQKV